MMFRMTKVNRYRSADGKLQELGGISYEDREFMDAAFANAYKRDTCLDDRYGFYVAEIVPVR